MIVFCHFRVSGSHLYCLTTFPVFSAPFLPVLPLMGSPPPSSLSPPLAQMRLCYGAGWSELGEVQGAGMEVPVWELGGALVSTCAKLAAPLQSPFLPTPISEALVRVTGRLNRALGISNLGGYYTGMFTERQLPGK